MGIAVLGPLSIDGRVDALSPRDRVVLSALVVRDRIRLRDGRTGAYEASIPLPDLPVTGLYPAGRAAPGTSIAYRPDSTGLLVTAADGRTWTVDTRLLHLGLSTARAPQASPAGRQSSGPMVARASAATTSTR